MFSPGKFGFLTTSHLQTNPEDAPGIGLVAISHCTTNLQRTEAVPLENRWAAYYILLTNFASHSKVARMEVIYSNLLNNEGLVVGYPLNWETLTAGAACASAALHFLSPGKDLGRTGWKSEQAQGCSKQGWGWIWLTNTYEGRKQKSTFWTLMIPFQ